MGSRTKAKRRRGSPVGLTSPALMFLLMGLWSSLLLPGVAGAMGAFTPPHTDHGLDVDGDGLFDFLVVDAVIEVTEANTFRVEGELHDENLTFGVSTANVTTLGVGSHVVPLWFYGPEINATGVDGPYVVDLILVDNTNLTFLDEDTHPTATYNHTDFDEFPALLQPPHGDHGVDTDADGRFNQLVVEVSVNVSDAGPFLIQGFLRDANFTLFLSANNESDLPAGIQTMQLRYPGYPINASGVDGPYTVSFQLTDVQTSTLLDTGIHATTAYSHLDFEEPPLALAPPHGDFGRDTDADGLFDFLVVNVTVNVSEAGSFFFQGGLHDPNGTFVVGAVNTSALGQGVHSVQLQYAGVTIKKSLVDGPYLVDLSVRNATTSNLIDSGNHTTAPYSHLDFAGPPVLLVPPHPEHPLDVDGDARIDYVVVNVTVEVSHAGTYLILGSVSFASNGTVAAQNVTPLEVGVQTVPLWFYGPALGGGPDGPYHVSLLVADPVNLTFFDSGVHTTNPYSAQDFEGPRELDSAPAIQVPTVDGEFAPEEWSDATLVNLSSAPSNRLPGLLYIKNDADRVYVGYDVTGDTTADDGDAASIGFDTEDDGLPSDGGEDEFVQEGLGQTHSAYNVTTGSWAAEDSPYNASLPDHEGLMSAAGFGSSENSQTDHRVYEFAIPLALLGAVEGDAIGFISGSHSMNGAFDGGTPYGYANWPDFAPGMPLWGYAALRLADITTPVLVVDFPGNGAFLGTSDISVEWTASDGGSGIERFEVSLDGGTPALLPPSTSSHTFTAVADGSHSIAVTAFDFAANSRVVTVNFTVDTVLPTLSIGSPTDGSILNASSVDVAWTASDADSGVDRVEVTLDSETPFVLGGTSNGHTFADVAEGAHAVNVTVVDRAGNRRSARLNLTVDTVPPTVSITSPAARSVLNSREMEVTWQAEDATSGIDHYEVRLDGGTAVTLAASATGYTFSDVADGLHSIAVVAIDRAGNVRVQTTDVTVDTNIFSPTGPYGILLLVAIPAAGGGAAAVVLALWIWRRRTG